MLRLNPGSTTLSTFFSSPLLSPGIETLVFPTVENLHVFQPESASRQGLDSQVLLLRIPQIFNHQMSHEIPMKTHETPKQIPKLSRSLTGTATPRHAAWMGSMRNPKPPPGNGRGQRWECCSEVHDTSHCYHRFMFQYIELPCGKYLSKTQKLFTPY